MTPENLKKRAIALLPDWKLIHAGGRDYELLTRLDGRWYLHADIRAITEDDALLQTNKRLRRRLKIDPSGVARLPVVFEITKKSLVWASGGVWR